MSVRNNAGDWNCPKCADHQFARNTHCRKCSTPRPTSGGVTVAGAPPAMKSDWNCPKCGDHQFARNTHCRRCSTPRPNGEGAAATAAPPPVPSDWNCPKCGDHQFARNTHCRKCSTPRPSCGQSSSSSSAAPPPVPSDWNCPKCGDHQFARNTHCRKCATPRPNGEGAAVSSSSSAAPPPVPSDWNCPKCGDHQFARNTHCRKCSTPRPNGEGAGASSSSSGAPVPPVRSDWNCPKCGDRQFARNTHCRKCSTANPNGVPQTSPVVRLAPGDWACRKCGEHNFARQTACRKCKTPSITALPISGEYPPSWTPQDENLVLVDVPEGSEEYNAIAKRVGETLPTTSLTVQRIQNKLLWKRFTSERELMTARSGYAPREEELFHGTKATDPAMVYNGQDGFDMRFCTSGMWGVASYFAFNASYSHGYAFVTPDKRKRIMMLAQVLVGDTVPLPSDSSLRMPPVKTVAEDGTVIRYDSVQGKTGGSDVIMTYHNGRAYPKYLLRYT